MPKLSEFIAGFRSVVLSTIDEAGDPFASYAPFVRQANRYYIFISDIARHARNLKARPACALFFIEDESTCENIFARKRVVLQCDAQSIARETPGFDAVMQAFTARFDPKLIATLRSMQDFNLYEFTPARGEAVFGFGQAYDIHAEEPDRLVPRSGIQGHQKN
jgi:hypothetical protein